MSIRQQRNEELIEYIKRFNEESIGPTGKSDFHDVDIATLPFEEVQIEVGRKRSL